MTTQTLIELQRNIVEGPWLVSNDGVFPDRPYCVVRAFYCVADVGSEVEAKAIALVPELIAEVIRLRKALRAVTSGYVKDRDYNNWHRLHGPTNADLNLARAALANDK